MQIRTWHTFPALVILMMTLLASGLLPGRTQVVSAAGIQLSQGTVAQGGTVTLTGAGFTAGDTATIYFDAPVAGHTQRIQATAPIAGDGGFSARLSPPRTVAPGVYTVTTKDAHGVTATTKLTVLPLLVLRAGAQPSAATVLAHAAFYVDAFGFTPNETVRIQVTFPTYSGNDVVVTRTPTADSHGTVLLATLAPPPGAKIGYAGVLAVGQTSNKHAPGKVYVVYRPFIYLKKTSITVGSAAGVVGGGFASYSNVQVHITITTGNGQQTLSVTASTDGHGNFTKYIAIPGYVNPGTYTVVATGGATGLKRYTKLTVLAHEAKATAMPTTPPTAKPTIQPTAKPVAQPTSKPLHMVVSVLPKQTLPNQYVSVAGSGFPANATVILTATIGLRGGGNRAVSKSVFSDSNGSFSTSLRVPYKAAQGTYGVVASAGSIRASDQLTVLPFSAHPSNLNFRWTSLWYHTVRHGTYDVIKIQSTLQTTLGIWVHVIFPSGQRHDYYTNTDGTGSWSTKFSIPSSAISKHSNQAYVTLQLWHGHQTTQSFIDFTLV